MSRELEFRRHLYELFDIRTDWLQHVLSGSLQKNSQRLTKNKIERTLSSLQKITTDALVRKLARTGFDKFSQPKRSWRVTKRKGWGCDEKKKSFQGWYKHQIGIAGCVYIFWKDRKCIYVGKTGRGGSRPSDHFYKFWFSGITRIDIYEVRHKRPLSALECLAIHRFRPSRNKLKTDRNCPLCRIHRRMKSELGAIFHLRRRRRRAQ